MNIVFTLGMMFSDPYDEDGPVRSWEVAYRSNIPFVEIRGCDDRAMVYWDSSSLAGDREQHCDERAQRILVELARIVLGIDRTQRGRVDIGLEGEIRGLSWEQAVSVARAVFELFDEATRPESEGCSWLADTPTEDELEDIYLRLGKEENIGYDNIRGCPECGSTMHDFCIRSDGYVDTPSEEIRKYKL